MNKTLYVDKFNEEFKKTNFTRWEYFLSLCDKKYHSELEKWFKGSHEEMRKAEKIASSILYLHYFEDELECYDISKDKKIEYIMRKNFYCRDLAMFIFSGEFVARDK